MKWKKKKQKKNNIKNEEEDETQKRQTRTHPQYPEVENGVCGWRIGKDMQNNVEMKWLLKPLTKRYNKGIIKRRKRLSIHQKWTNERKKISYGSPISIHIVQRKTMAKKYAGCAQLAKKTKTTHEYNVDV